MRLNSHTGTIGRCQFVNAYFNTVSGEGYGREHADRLFDAILAGDADSARSDADRDVLGDEVADHWKGCDRTEAIRQAEAKHAALQSAHRTIDRLREQLAADADRVRLVADPQEIDRLRAQVVAVKALTVHDDGGPRIQGDRVFVADVRAALAVQPRDLGRAVGSTRRG